MARDPICALVHRYSDAVVHFDGDQWGSTWAEDAVWEIGKDRRVEGRLAILELWHGAMTGFGAVLQMVLNGDYDLDEVAGTGVGRWYIAEHWQRANGEKGKILGHYDDRYARVDGRWLFASRRLTIHYNGPQDLSGPFHNAWGPADD